MIIFEYIFFKNFLATGDTGTKINLNDAKTTMIRGKNGMGKSSLLDALSFALFGKPHRNIRKPQLVNSINGKKLLVEVQFSINGTKYLVRRGMKPNIFEIYKDDELLNQSSHSRDYQKILENDILKMNHRSFHQVVVLGSGNFVPFMQLPLGQRRGVIEELLDIVIFSTMADLAKEEGGSLKRKLDVIKNDIERVGDRVNMQTKHISKLKLIASAEQSRIDEERKTLNDEILDIDTKRQELQRKYDSSIMGLREEVEDLSREKGELSSKIGEYRSTISALTREKEFFENNDNCSKCHQPINDDHSQSIINECLSDINKQNEYLEARDTKLKDTSYRHRERSDFLSHIDKIPVEIRGLDTQLAGIRAKLSKLDEFTTDTSKDIEKAESDMTTYEKANINLRASKTKLDDQIMLNTSAHGLLKDSGIKTKIIRQYLPLMNKTINRYLNILDFFVLFHLDEEFTETIRSRHRDDFSYASFSEGEKQRIDLALLFAWRTIAKAKNSVNTNLLILDEIFDSSLDEEGVENLLKILREVSQDNNVFVITHHPESFENAFEQRITVSKKGNFSDYFTERLK